MKAVRRFLAALLAVGFVIYALSWVTDRTTWNSSYLMTTATQTKLATNLSGELPEIATSYDASGAAKAAIATVVTPDYVSSQLASVFPAFVDAYRNGGPAPTLNLTAISTQLSVIGATISPSLSSVLDRPVPILPAGISDKLRDAGSITRRLHPYVPVAIGMLLVIIVLISGRYRFKTLSASLLVAAIGTLIFAAVVYIPPRLIAAALENSVASPVAGTIRDYAATIATRQAHLLLEWSAGFAIIAVLLFATGLIVGITSRFRKADHEKKNPELPTGLKD